MAKSHKTKKHLKSEKAKTKLKVRESKTKFLPKGTNVTDLNFKIKQIIVPQQLKEHGDEEIVSKRKLNVRELLMRLKHYNVNIKSDALRDLIEVFTSCNSEPLLLSFVSEILQHSCRLVLDKEKNVRYKAIQLISLITSFVDKEKLYPFSNILLSHLKCAMTDIDRNVQSDSLLLLDRLVTNVPEVICEHSNQILPIFFVLISSITNNSSKSKMLSLNPQGTSTSTRWRLLVLNRLQKILKVTSHTLDKKWEITSCNEKMFYGYYFPVYNNYWGNYPNSFFSKNDNDHELNDKENGTVSYINSLVPLLYDTWLEVLPDSSNQTQNIEAIILSQEASSIFNCILMIFYYLWQFSQGRKTAAQEMYNLFTNKVGKKFLSRVLKQYPFSQSNISQKMLNKELKNILELNSDPKCVQLNLLICYLFCVVNKKLCSDQQKMEAEKVLDYLRKCLLNRNYVKEENIHYLIEIMQIILLVNCSFWIKSLHNIMIEILNSFVHFYEHSTFKEEHETKIMDILCEVTQNTYLNSSEAFQNWLKNLPKCLSKSDVPISVVRTVSLLSKQMNNFVQEGLCTYLPDILENLETFDLEDNKKKTVFLSILSCCFYISYYQKNKETYDNFVTKHQNTNLGKIIQETMSFSYCFNN